MSPIAIFYTVCYIDLEFSEESEGLDKVERHAHQLASVYFLDHHRYSVQEVPVLKEIVFGGQSSLILKRLERIILSYRLRRKHESYH